MYLFYFDSLINCKLLFINRSIYYFYSNEQNAATIKYILFYLSAALYGEGTYFAVHASYSAHPSYSKPAADGSQLMFVAKVLTGVYTKGKTGMKIPPARDEQQPHDRYDSVVDATDNPNMYIVFHDDQAYPDYLITFK